MVAESNLSRVSLAPFPGFYDVLTPHIVLYMGYFIHYDLGGTGPVRKYVTVRPHRYVGERHGTTSSVQRYDGVRTFVHCNRIALVRQYG